MAHTGKGQRRYQRKSKISGEPETKHLIKMHVKKDDLVEILSGDEKGKRGKVLRSIPNKRMVVIQGINKKWKHLRRSQENPQGGRLEREAPMHASKVRRVEA